MCDRRQYISNRKSGHKDTGEHRKVHGWHFGRVSPGKKGKKTGLSDQKELSYGVQKHHCGKPGPHFRKKRAAYHLHGQGTFRARGGYFRAAYREQTDNNRNSRTVPFGAARLCRFCVWWKASAMRRAQLLLPAQQADDSFQCEQLSIFWFFKK